MGSSDETADDFDAVAVREPGVDIDARAESREPEHSQVESVVRDEPGVAQRVGDGRAGRQFHGDEVLHCGVAHTTVTITRPPNRSLRRGGRTRR